MATVERGGRLNAVDRHHRPDGVHLEFLPAVEPDLHFTYAPRKERNGRDGMFWTAAGSEAPNRFGTGETGDEFHKARSLESGVAAALCHRTPRRYRAAPFLKRVLLLRLLLLEGRAQEPVLLQALHERVGVGHYAGNLAEHLRIQLYLAVQVAGDLGKIVERLGQGLE